MELKTVVILLLLGGLGWFGYDSMAKRKALEASQKEVERLVAERGQGREEPRVTRGGAPVPAATPPGWFQDRLQERPALETAVKQRNEQQQSHYPTATPR